MRRLDFEAVHRAASVADLLEPLRSAFVAGATTPTRSHMNVGDRTTPGTLLIMPSWRAGSAIGIKVATVYPRNAGKALPTVHAEYLLINGQTGSVDASIDGRALTLLRTGAVSALAADALASRLAKRLLIVGTGALVPYLVDGHTAVREYRDIEIWGRNPDKAAALVRQLAEKGTNTAAHLAVASDLEGASRRADVIVCATMSDQPLIRGAWLGRGTHLNLIGGFRPDMREADDDCVRRSLVVTDTLAALDECGDLREPLAHGVLQRSDVVLLERLLEERVMATAADLTIFKSVGVGTADLAAAEFLVRGAAQAG